MFMKNSTCNVKRLIQLLEFYNNDVDSFDLGNSRILLLRSYHNGRNIQSKNSTILNKCNYNSFSNI